MKKIIGLLTFLLFIFSAKAQQTEVQYLSGTGPDNTVEWDFWCSAGMNSQKWSKIQVPSCWEQQGFGGYTYGRYYIYEREKEKQYANYRDRDFCDEYGIYRHSFDIPISWKDRQISIVFEGVMTDAEVKINGTTYTSTSNTISSDVSRIKGVTIDLKGLTEGSAVTLTVERDKETVANAVAGVVDAYNEYIKNFY